MEKKSNANTLGAILNPQSTAFPPTGADADGSEEIQGDILPRESYEIGSQKPASKLREQSENTPL